MLPEQEKPDQKFFPDSGIHLVDGDNEHLPVAIISFNTWEEVSEAMKSSTVKFAAPSTVFLFPELITVAGSDFSELLTLFDVVQLRVGEILDLSKELPHAYFVLGTPEYSNQWKPKNALYVIKNGEIADKSYKRAGADKDEKKDFQFVADQKPVSFQGNSILICVEALFAWLKISEASLSNTVFVDPNATTVLVSSVWGVGGSKEVYQKMRETGYVNDVDGYYRMNMNSAAKVLFRYHPKLKRIIFSDRVLDPEGFEEEEPFLSTKPLSAVYYRTGAE